ncbi:helix-turn-helix transcriptional regulator [Streptomyces rubiginosohelvolus]|uniref:helix-turn-helix transcriptional regulator n=1 Tax=Streptomyces rubiginosohelvolus TaxID=67362 RepID=UPI003680B73B
MSNRYSKNDSRAVELGQFLAARRAGVRPEQVGLPAGTRRRPGLRREEVAMLAGVGASWYQWIEQGRAKNVSREILEAISGVLCLDPVEHGYVMRLAGMAEGPTIARRGDFPLIAEITDAYLPLPAYAVDAYWNVIAANTAAVRLFGERLRGGNYLQLLFTDPDVRDLFTDWETDASDAVARFRAHSGGLVDSGCLDEFIGELRQSSGVFDALWGAHDVSDGSCALQDMKHPELGRARFQRVSLNFTCAGGYRLVLLHPDEPTRQAMHTCWSELGEPIRRAVNV